MCEWSHEQLDRRAELLEELAARLSDTDQARDIRTKAYDYRIAAQVLRETKYAQEE